METNKASNRLHPLVAAAAVSVMLVSLTGVAAITGIIPMSHSTATPAAVPAPTVSAAPAAVSAPTPVVVAASAPTASIDAKAAANNVVNPQPKRVAAAPASNPAPSPAKSYAPREVKNTQPAPRTYQYAEPTTVAQAPKICDNCGRIESVYSVQTEAQPSGVGVVAGAVLGGVLGNQVGGGNGKKLATVAGAVGGGFAGNEIEKRARSATTYEVRVRMDNGTVRTFPYNNQPHWGIGDRVKVVDGYLTTQA